MRRAGMDYLDHVALTWHVDWHAFQAAYPGGKVGGASAAPGGTPRGTTSTANAGLLTLGQTPRTRQLFLGSADGGGGSPVG